jgi:hypothetical protein
VHEAKLTGLRVELDSFRKIDGDFSTILLGKGKSIRKNSKKINNLNHSKNKLDLVSIIGGLTQLTQSAHSFKVHKNIG